MFRVHRTRVVWNPALDEKLMGLFNYGLRPKDVAEEMGMSVATVEGRYYRLKKLKEQADAEMAKK